MKNIGKSTSVIIRVRNQEIWIGHCIQSVLEFYGCEIIIIDNNADEETISICKYFQKKVLDDFNTSYAKLKFHKIKDYTPGKALNKGVNIATRENILILSVIAS